MSSPALDALRPIPSALWQETRALAADLSTWREPVKAVLAVLLATAVSCAFHLEDNAWAALSGFLVMRTSFGESAPRGGQRMLGTLAGAALGFGLARYTSASVPLLMVTFVVVTFVCVYQSTVSVASYAWVLFGVTAAMVMTAAFASPADTIDFASTRIAEVGIGTLCGIVVSGLFELFRQPSAPPPQPLPSPGSRLTLRRLLDENWRRDHAAILAHASRAAIAVGSLPLVWRAFSITDISATAVTSFIVMIMPATVVEQEGIAAIYQRAVYRVLGCVMGGLLALLLLPLAGDSLPLYGLTLALGVGIGVHIQGGRSGLSYVGTQFCFAFIVTLVQGPGPATSITPGFQRLVGIAIGCLVLGAVVVVWPPPPVRTRRAA
ncbi:MULTISPECIES: FUSC family protein [unclassified Acidisoma]|jgi:uncharacterized membrane protein YccC|uniref:FUSC family protein n=1 Tax=unclassified Acidisoma TaxID=2634065 RepID=UPI00131DAE00|nr:MULTISPECIES: FUSC family protein [unclassified Acidisoma]